MKIPITCGKKEFSDLIVILIKNILKNFVDTFLYFVNIIVIMDKPSLESKIKVLDGAVYAGLRQSFKYRRKDFGKLFRRVVDLMHEAVAEILKKYGKEIEHSIYLRLHLISIELSRMKKGKIKQNFDFSQLLSEQELIYYSRGKKRTVRVKELEQFMWVISLACKKIFPKLYKK